MTSLHLREPLRRDATVIEFPARGAQAIECAGCGQRFEESTAKRTALAYREHRCGTTDPFDWDNLDEFTSVTLPLRLTQLEVNHLIAWLEHPTAPEAIRELGAKVRQQASTGDRR